MNNSTFKFTIIVVVALIDCVVLTAFITNSSPIVGKIPSGNLFETNLELENVSSIVIHEKNEKLPIYVKELYETVKSENLPTKNDYSSPLTIQAIRQERKDVSSIADDANDGVLMKFSLKKLWIRPYSMARAELVLGVRKNLIHPSSRYVVNVYAMSSDDADDNERELVSQILNVNNDDADHADYHFLVVPFTDIVKNVIQDWRKSNNRTEILSVRLNVDEQISSDNADDVYQMETKQVRRLFRSTNHGHYSPLLILYSSPIDSPPFSLYNRRRKRRLRRSNDDDDDATPSTTNPSTYNVGVSYENCAVRPWRVNLREYFSHEIITPHFAQINFCSGKCPFPAFDSHWNSTSNAVVRKNFVTTGVNNGGISDLPLFVPDTFCVPKSYNSLTTLSLKDNGQYLIEKKVNMIAVSCMCA